MLLLLFWHVVSCNTYKYHLVTHIRLNTWTYIRTLSQTTYFSHERTSLMNVHTYHTNYMNIRRGIIWIIEQREESRVRVSRRQSLPVDERHVKRGALPSFQGREKIRGTSYHSLWTFLIHDFFFSLSNFFSFFYFLVCLWHL